MITPLSLNEYTILDYVLKENDFKILSIQYYDNHNPLFVYYKNIYNTIFIIYAVGNLSPEIHATFSLTAFEANQNYKLGELKTLKLTNESIQLEKIITCKRLDDFESELNQFLIDFKNHYLTEYKKKYHAKNNLP